jgi:hypothetical protein
MAKSKNRRKKKKAGGGGGGSSSGSGGSMMSMRSGFKSLVGGGKSNKGPKTPLQKAWDVIFWVLLAAAAGYFIYMRFVR